MNFSEQKCPICITPGKFISYGVVAPWISELSKKGNSLTELLICPSCSLQYFSHRYSIEELNCIYSGYRSEEFYEVRHSWEPWYTRSVNNAFDELDSNSEKSIQARRQFMAQGLKNAGLDERIFHNCIDFGGDLGQFFPDGLTGRRILIDLSNIPREGVEVFSSLSEVDEKVDLVMNCNVLEHMSELDQILIEMRNCLSENGVIYLEVPLDRFKVAKFNKSNTYRRYLTWLISHRKTFIIVDFLSGLFRQFLGFIPAFGVVKQSEHINYFNSHSLKNYVSRFDLSVIAISDPDFNYRVGHIRQGRINLICR